MEHVINEVLPIKRQKGIQTLQKAFSHFAQGVAKQSIKSAETPLGFTEFRTLQHNVMCFITLKLFVIPNFILTVFIPCNILYSFL